MPPKGWKKDLSVKKEVAMNGQTTPKPTEEQIQEVIDPGLSKDIFRIGNKEFPIQILPIAYEKKIALSLSPFFKRLDQFTGKSFTDVLAQGGGELINECLDVFIDIILIICRKYDSAMDREYIENNINLAEIWSIISKQMEKNKLGDMISGFFLKVATIMPPLQESPKS